MKILIISHTAPPEKTGIAIYIKNLMRHINATFDIVAPSTCGGIRVSRPTMTLPTLKCIKKLILSDAEVFHIHGYVSIFALLGIVIGLIRKKNIIWTWHGKPKLNGMLSLLLAIYEKVANVLARMVTVTSVTPEKNAIWTPNGIELERFTPRSSYKTKSLICYIGRLDRDKNIDRIIKECRRKILIVGPDEGIKENLKILAKKLKREVEFAEVPYELIPKVYEKCRCIVLPSSYEGFPTILLESIAMKRPILVTPVGIVPKILKELELEEFLLDKNIEKKIKELEKIDLEEKLEKARRLIRKYSWKNIAKIFSKLYEKKEKIRAFDGRTTSHNIRSLHS